MNETPLQKIMRNRRSIRRFLETPVDREKIMVCLEAALLAPSADNVRPWRFLVVDEPELKSKLCAAAFSGIFSFSKFAAQAPVMIVMLDRPDFKVGTLGKMIRRVAFDMIDIGIAGEHIVLQAEELGLASCWIGWFNEKKLRKALKIPRKYKIVALLPLGYAKSRPSRSPARKSIEEVAWFNSFKEEPESESKEISSTEEADNYGL